jgi:hypothetical protein
MPQTQIAFTTWPRCRYPVGAGANRVSEAVGRSVFSESGAGSMSARAVPCSMLLRPIRCLSHQIVSRLTSLLVLLVLARTASAQDAFEQQRAAALAGMRGVDPIVATLTEGKTTYRIGEPIPLRLEFQPIGRASLVDSYCEPGFGLDVVFDRSPTAPAPPSAPDLSREDDDCGLPSGVWGWIAGVTPPPVHKDVTLNQAVRLDVPGTYRFYLRTHFNEPHDNYGTPPRLSNLLTIEIVDRDPEWEASVIARAAERLDASGGSGTPDSIVSALAGLGTEAAVDLLARQPDDALLSLAWSARNRTHVIKRIVERLDDPSRPVDRFYVATLAAVEAARLAGAGRPDRVEYERLRREYAARRLRVLAIAGQLDAHLATAMHDAAGAGLAGTYSRIIWKSLPNAFADVPEAVERALQTLPPARQRFVLEDRFGWRDFADPVFLPMFRRLAASRAPDGPQDIALSMWFLHAPDEARRFAWRELASPETHLGAVGLEALPEQLLPQFDNAMATRLEAAIDGEAFGRAISVIERAGSSRIRRRVIRAFERAPFAATCPHGPVALAYFFRVEPAYAVRQLDRVADASQEATHFCRNSSILLSVARHGWMPALEDAAIARLRDPRLWMVVDAAETLGRYGSARSEEVLWRAFGAWRARWASRAAELDSGPRTNDRDWAWATEDTLAEALLDGSAWRGDAAAEARIATLCVSRRCRSRHVGPNDFYDRPTIAVSAPMTPHGAPHVGVGRASVDDMTRLRAQLALWPRGTVWQWSDVGEDGFARRLYATPLWLPEAKRATLAAVRRFVESRGMTLTKP